MWDKTVPDIHLRMDRPTLEHLPGARFPEGYSTRLYRPGDERHWARIEQSAEEFDTLEKALAGFGQAFGAEREQLPRRMLFLLDEGGQPVGTTTAWMGEGGLGRIHWVGIDQAHQGKGLSAPLVAGALQLLRELGHTSTYLTTQAPSWVAIRVYLKLGFLPAPLGTEREEEGWRIVRAKLPDMSF